VTPRLATFSIFAINGAMIGTWIAHIPWLQDHLGVSKATIGLCLLCMAAGALVSMPLTGHVLDRRSSASVTRAATLVFCLMLPLPLLATSPYMLGAILFVFGASTGAMDVAMNAHGVAIQSRLARPIMSSLHGGWSLGGFASAGLVAAAATIGVDPRLESLVVGAALWLAALWLTRRLGSASAQSATGGGLALPSRAVLLVGGLCFMVMLTEGGIEDWSGIYLRHDAGASSAASAMAFTGFSLGMAVARLGGDTLNQWLGAEKLLRGGTALVAIALGGVLLIGATVPAVIGFALCGLGIANAVPLLFSAAGRLEPPGPSLAAAFTLGYMGFIVGPPVIGLLSDRIGLPRTLTLLVFTALAATALGRRATASTSGTRSSGQEGTHARGPADAATF
jgi:predicted MFS family arabinose efflux permease